MNEVWMGDIEKSGRGFAIYIYIKSPGGGSTGYVLMNHKALELLVKVFGVKNRSELKGKTFESNESSIPEKALTNLLKKSYPHERNIVVTGYKKNVEKYNPKVWTISKIWPVRKHFLFGPGEEDYCPITLEGHYKGYVFPCVIGQAFLRESNLKPLMEHFGVTKLNDLIGKEFRVNVDDPQSAMLILVMKQMDPSLV